MTMTLAEKSIAILAANGFDENHITEIQRALTRSKINFKVIAPEQGLVNGWQDNAWGHYFSVDMPISTALGSDFDALVLVGGERGIAKLKTNLHTKRIVNHFVEAGKPIAAIGAGVSLLALSPNMAGRTVAAAAELQDELKMAKIEISDQEEMVDEVILTVADTAAIAPWVETAISLFNEIESMDQAA